MFAWHLAHRNCELRKMLKTEYSSMSLWGLQYWQSSVLY